MSVLSHRPEKTFGEAALNPLKNILLILSLLFAAFSMPLTHAETKLTLTNRCFLPGLEDAAHCLKLVVPLDWNNPQGPSITVFAAVFPALSRGAHRDPLFIVPGGPGQSGDMLLLMVRSVFSGVNKTHDLVLIYPRGTARSSPLNCPQHPELEVVDDTQIARQFATCARAMKNNPKYFSSTEIVRDTNAIREALGYDLINLWGGSFGTRLAQHYSVAYPAHVRTLVLDGATRLGQSVFITIPHSVDVAMNSIAIMCKLAKPCATQGDDIRNSLHTLLTKLQTQPQKMTIDDPLTGVARTISVNDKAILNILGVALYAPESRAIVPVMIRMALHGNYQPLIAMAAQVGTQLNDDSFSSGSQLSVLCAEDFSYTTRTDVSDAAKGTLIGTADYDRTAKLCSVWPHGTIAKAAWQPTKSSVPALILSGGLDPVTPPPLGAATVAQFINGTHIVAQASGHGVSLFGCAPKIITDFINQATMIGIDTSCLTKPKPQAPLAGLNG